MPFPGQMPGMPGEMDASGANALPELAMSSLDQLQGGDKQAEVFARTDEALGLSHKLLMSVLPQITNINPSVAKDLHQIAQRVLQVQMDVKAEMPVGNPPPELMSLLDSTGQEGQPMPSPSPFMPGM
jgi:hypothetical protein